MLGSTLGNEPTLLVFSLKPCSPVTFVLSTALCCPRENSREGFRLLVERMQTFVPLTQIQVLLEVSGHYHRALMHYLQDLGIPVYIIHGQQAAGGTAQIR